MMTLEQIRGTEYGAAKYVRIGDEFRFGDVYGMDHIQYLKKGEVATSAASIIFDSREKVVTVKGESMTLKIGPAPDDQEKIKALLYP